MALANRSVFLYGYEITELNNAIDFYASPLDAPTPRQATLSLGFYSLTSLLNEVARALTAADPLRIYTATVDRTVAGGLQNRVTISSNGTYFQLLFASGPRTTSSVAPLLGFALVDRTGALTYTGNSSTGTILAPTMRGYNFVPPENMQKVFGSVNVSASGLKEAVVFNVQQFWSVEFRYEPVSALADWRGFLTWAIQQRRLEFTPDVSQPTIFYEGTLEKTGADPKGLAFELKEMLPQFPNFYQTGMLQFRKGLT